MTRKQFVNYVWKHVKRDYRYTRDDALFWVNIVLDDLLDCVIDNPEVHIQGFGVFSHKFMKGRHQKNYLVGGDMNMPDYERLKFAASRSIQKAVKDGMTSEEYHDMLEKSSLLRRGGHLYGYELGGDGYAKRVEVEEDLSID